MDKRTLAIYGIVFLVLQFILNCGIFVRFSDMEAYAASKDSMVQITEQLTRIEQKIDKVMGY